MDSLQRRDTDVTQRLDKQGAVLADTTNDAADFQWVTGHTNAQTLAFTFTYMII